MVALFHFRIVKSVKICWDNKPGAECVGCDVNNTV